MLEWNGEPVNPAAWPGEEPARGMTVHYGNYFDKYSSRNPLVQYLVKGFLNTLYSAIDLTGGTGGILEIGAGDGSLSTRILDRYPDFISLTALDPGFNILKQGKFRDRRIRFANASIYELPFPDASFDLVLIPEVLEHLENPLAGLAESIRVGRDHFIISVPWEPAWRVGNFLTGRYVSSWGDTPGHIQHWSRSGIIRLIGNRLKILRVLKPFPWTMILARKSGI
ncbi:class I SAM-dependent methyltransferase [bacterium]|nr:class I SAM-dependent methyltransferase [candidate division CSSED10-310 bacterium]